MSISKVVEASGNLYSTRSDPELVKLASEKPEDLTRHELSELTDELTRRLKYERGLESYTQAVGLVLDRFPRLNQARQLGSKTKKGPQRFQAEGKGNPSERLHEAVLRYQRAHPEESYSAAKYMVLRDDKDLRESYGKPS